MKIIRIIKVQNIVILASVVYTHTIYCLLCCFSEHEYQKQTHAAHSSNIAMHIFQFSLHESLIICNVLIVYTILRIHTHTHNMHSKPFIAKLHIFITSRYDICSFFSNFFLPHHSRAHPFLIAFQLLLAIFKE